MSEKYKTCSNCIMDITDLKIKFDVKGVCDHCRKFNENILPIWQAETGNLKKLDSIVSDIKKAGKSKEFDCLLGLSGGIDSSYMLHYMVTNYNIRPLVFHVDGGWNSELAVNNIQVLIDKLGLDLYTEVIDWEEMRDLQLAFFKSGVPHIDIPQDHAFIATLYNFAEKYKVKYILNGFNFSTEGVRNPMEWLYYGTDMRQIKDIHKRYGSIPLKNYPLSPILRHKFYLRYIKGIKVVKPLNIIRYNKKEAIKILSDEYGWKEYPQKHFESRFTKFYEGYWLPEKFGYDTRKVQYSSLILTGQMTREEALEKLNKPAYDPETIDHEFEYIATKLRISVEELRSYFYAPNKTYKDYKNQVSLFKFGANVLNFLGIEKAIKR